MSLPLLVRPLAQSEMSLVLAAWKKSLYEERFRERWGRFLDGECFWLLVNYVIECVTIPSSKLLVGCYETEPQTPLCWIAIRPNRRVPVKHDVLYLDTRHEIRKDAPLAAALHLEFTSIIDRAHALMPEPRPHFNPFKELAR